MRVSTGLGYSSIERNIELVMVMMLAGWMGDGSCGRGRSGGYGCGCGRGGRERWRKRWCGVGVGGGSDGRGGRGGGRSDWSGGEEWWMCGRRRRWRIAGVVHLAAEQMSADVQMAEGGGWKVEGEGNVKVKEEVAALG